MSRTRSMPAQIVVCDPPYNLSSIFSAHRDLRPYAKWALGDSGLSIEEADILILLFGAAKLGWDDLPMNSDGFVALKHLRAALVHDPSLFARRLKKLVAGNEPLIEVTSMKFPAGLRLHGNNQGARITKAGIATARSIWDTFRKLEAKLLEGLPQADLKAHERVNEAISQRLRDLADPAKQLLAD